MAKPITTETVATTKTRGQALVEYALILALLAVAFGFALAATGPAIGNVFCNVVDNLGGRLGDEGPQGGFCGDGGDPLDVAGGNPNLFWQTVTWVATNEQQETPFPTPVNRPPTNPPGQYNTPTQTLTPSLTPTQTLTPSLTPSLTPTTGASATPTDIAFQIPHVDQINNPDWWRIDNSTTYFLGAGGETWSATWYDDISNEWDTANWSMNASQQRNTLIYNDSNLNFNWGDGWGTPPGFPDNSGITNQQDWGGVFTRNFSLAQAQSVIFRLCAQGDMARLFVNGVREINRTSSGCTNRTVNLPAGGNTIIIEYANLWNTAALSLTANIPSFTVNPDDVGAGCSWGQASHNNNSNSPTYMFDWNPNSSNWNTNRVCNLELRGYVDVTGSATPIFSFWDTWDFMLATNATVQVQVANYVTTAGAFDRAATWSSACTFSLHNPGTRNYNWTRNQLDLRSQCPGLGNLITFRFVIGSTTVSGNNPFRWYIDDIQLLDEPAPTRTFTIGDAWDLNATNQMNDFLFNADSTFNIGNYGLPVSPSSPRWTLVTPAGNRAHSGMAFTQNDGSDYRPNSYGISGQNAQNAYSLEFKYPINLTASPLPADAEGDTGDPILSFWLAHDLNTDAGFFIEYTTSPRNRTGAGGQLDNAPDDWQVIPNEGVIIDYTDPAGSPLPNQQVPRDNLNSHFITVNLAAIPNWNTTSFRLRFVLYVNSGNDDGVFIDDIRIEREDSSPYLVYPFFDDTEDPTFTSTAWLAPVTASGQSPWGQTTSVGGYNNNPSAYADSPSGSYADNRDWSFEMQRYIDLLNDTTLNTTDPASRPPAVDPVFSFWHRRHVADSVQFRVEAQLLGSSTWTTVWTYDSNSSGGSPAPNARRQQEAWERIEISIPAALQTISGSTWTTIQSNADEDDDDIRFRFRFTSSGGGNPDGVYVDDIRIEDGVPVHRLWATASGGDGIFPTNIAQQETFDGFWWNNWFVGGDWNIEVNRDSYYHSVPNALADSPTGATPGNNSRNYTFAMLELDRIIDLTNTTAAQYPILRFWTRYNISNNDNLRVQVAVENASSLTQSWNKVGGWNAWVDRTIMAGVPQSTLTNENMVTWQRAQVDLSPFVGGRVRIRFVMDTPGSSTHYDGAYIDDVSVTFGTRSIPLPFIDGAQSMINWVSEGVTGSSASVQSWGLDPSRFVGIGTAAADLGATAWQGYFFDCELNGYGGCNQWTFQEILHNNPNPTGTAADYSIMQDLPTSSINYFWGNTRPLPASSPASYDDTFVARWVRTVTLDPGSYTFQTISDDGVRLYLDNYAGTNFGNVTFNRTATSVGGPYIINNWGYHGNQLDTTTITVTSPVPIVRTLTLEFFEGGGSANIYLGATRSSFSFSDSPNLGGEQDTPADGNFSLISDGFFNLSPTGPSTLTYQRLWDFNGSQRFYVEYSTDGGFTWTQVDSITGGSRTIEYGWEPRTINMTGVNSPAVLLRFRMDTRTESNPDDGVWITDIRLSQN